MGVRAFGPMAIVGPAGPVLVTGQREAALLAVLAAGTGVVVGRDRLVDELWSDGAGSVATLRVVVNRLRKRCSTVTGANPIRTEGHGYVLDVEPAEVDVARFRQLAVKALAAHGGRRPRDVVAGFEAAEGCWVGEPFEGIVDVPMVGNVRRELHQLRSELTQAYATELLLVDRSRQARWVLERLVESDPYREDAWALLAVSLYRQHRQADALRQLGMLRGRLRDDLGITPSAAVQRLEMAMLSQTEPELVGLDFLRPTSLSTIEAPPRRQGIDEFGVAESLDVDVDTKLRAAGALMRAGVVDEAAAIIGDAEELVRAANDAPCLARVLLARAELAVLGDGDPHPLIDEAQRIGRRLGDGDLLARAAMTRFGAGVPDDKSSALIELTEPIALLEPSDARRIDLLCAAAVIVTFIDASPAAGQLLDEAERVHRQIASAHSEAVLLIARSLVGAVQGRPLADVEADAERAFRISRELDDPRLVVSVIQAMLRHRFARGDLAGVDELLDPLDEAARVAILPFGSVRVLLCRTMICLARGELERVPDLIESTRALGARLRTFAAESASAAQQLLLHLELERSEEVESFARVAAAARGPSVWNAVLALSGDCGEAARLVDVAAQVRDDDTRKAFIALAAQVAASRTDGELGAWCAPHLEELGGLTIVVGLGTAVFGFAAHFAGLARIATGELETAAAHLERASSLAADVGAHLWTAHSDLELADVLGRVGRVDEARARLAAVEQGEMLGQSLRLSSRFGAVSSRLGHR